MKKILFMMTSLTALCSYSSDEDYNQDNILKILSEIQEARNPSVKVVQNKDNSKLVIKSPMSTIEDDEVGTTNMTVLYNTGVNEDFLAYTIKDVLIQLPNTDSINMIISRANTIKNPASNGELTIDGDKWQFKFGREKIKVGKDLYVSPESIEDYPFNNFDPWKIATGIKWKLNQIKQETHPYTLGVLGDEFIKSPGTMLPRLPKNIQLRSNGFPFGPCSIVPKVITSVTYSGTNMKYKQSFEIQFQHTHLSKDESTYCNNLAHFEVDRLAQFEDIKSIKWEPLTLTEKLINVIARNNTFYKNNIDKIRNLPLDLQERITQAQNRMGILRTPYIKPEEEVKPIVAIKSIITPRPAVMPTPKVTLNSNAVLFLMGLLKEYLTTNKNPKLK